MTIRESYDVHENSAAPWLRVSIGAGLVGPDGVAGPTIFEKVGQAAAEHGALNLGQGFPDEDGPAWLLSSAAEAIRQGPNQYAPGVGMLPLREAIAEHQRAHYDISLDPGTDVLVTAGATEALAAALLAFIEPGDEVISFDPSYDEYGAHVALARGIHVRVPLELTRDESGRERYRLPLDELERAVTKRTRIIIVNDPHNPTGMQFTDEERAAIVRAAERADALIVTDEVYEHQWFEAPHRSLAALDGAFERTLAISSAGKTFAVTGWKTGWITGPAHLVSRARAVKQYLSFCSSPAYQLAIAEGLADDRGWIEQARTQLKRKRDRFSAGLTAAGWAPLTPDATFFILAAPPAWLADRSDPRRSEQAALALPQRAGVAGIPTTAFIPASSQAGHLVRFAFCKRDEVLDDAVARLTRAAESQ